MTLPRNELKHALAEGRQQIGLWAAIPDPAVVEALAGCGYDWLLIDTEHSPVDPAGVLPLLQACAPYPGSAVVRPAENDTALIKRHLDMGAQSLLIPYIQSRAEAQAAVDAVRYPPRGVRGYAGLTRANRYGTLPDYARTCEEEICLLLQVETIAAVERLDEIATVDGVDGIFIGPADLAASMGYPGEPAHPEVMKVVEDTIRRLAALGKPSGFLSLDPDICRRCIEAGSTFTAVGVDFALMLKAARALRQEFPAA